MSFIAGSIFGVILSYVMLKIFLAGAERSGGLQACPPSATGCPGARADGQTKADSSGRCPEVNGPRCPIANAVALQVLNRSETGFKKYGVTVGRDDLSLLQWLQHLQEELLDAAVYVERLKIKTGGVDAGQCNGQRVLPDNSKLMHGQQND